MDMAASSVSAVSEVRKAMTGLQRKMGKGMTLVAEGRDMGTIVFPDAKHKFYLTASLEIRTERRHKERLERGETVSRALVENQLKKRDHQDKTRTIAPLRAADDAKIIDTTEMTPEQVLGTILCHLDLE
jgi:cytidylate kinase